MNKYILTFCSLIISYHSFTLSAVGESQIYSPIPLQPNQLISDTLSSDDIPTGEGGFAKDYTIFLNKGDQIAIDVMSEDFDTVVMLIAEDGTTVAENDDAPDHDSNSLLFTRIAETGRYTIRVRAFGAVGNGKFTIQLTKLQPIVN
ncbi:PPC domain-containing protein [Geminocystis sp. CENA526]|uniref:PPC domain-containing protein n=1 Tax=Geminocystis sp. CENA526 TaxID=1355871 RepID=UPI003D6F862E